MVRKNWVSAGMLVLGLCAVVPAFAQSSDTCKFEVRTRSKVGFRGTAKYFIKGNWVRQEKRSGGGLELIMVSNDTGLFIRNGSKHANYWFKYPNGMNTNLKDRLLGGPVGDVPTFLKKAKAKKTGQEKKGKEMCTIWSYKYPRTSDKFRVWVSDITGKPVQLERDHIIRGTAKRDILVVEYRSYESQAPIPDTLFKVPAGVKVHDMARTMAAAGAAPTAPAAATAVPDKK